MYIAFENSFCIALLESIMSQPNHNTSPTKPILQTLSIEILNRDFLLSLGLLSVLLVLVGM
jgi:hypothetical protein